MNAKKRCQKAKQFQANGVSEEHEVPDEHEEPSDDDHEDAEQEIDDQSDTELRALIGQRVTVDFEGRCAIDPDIDGMCQLLSVMIPRAQVSWRQLAELLVDQNHVGCVLKQCDSGSGRDDDEEEDIMDVDGDKEVYGVSAVVSLSGNTDQLCVQQIKSILLQQCQNAGAVTDESKAYFNRVLTSTADNVGLIINERFVNIPVEIAAPLLTTLCAEIATAAQQNASFRFTHYIIICKLHVPTTRNDRDRAGGDGDCASDEIWVNDEERLLLSRSVASLYLPIGGGGVSRSRSVAGDWSDEDAELVPRRRALLLPASALVPAVAEIEKQLQSAC